MKMDKAQDVRVQKLIEQDRRDREAEQRRRLAEAGVAEGRFEGLEDTVVPPTPEWMAKGAVEKFTPRSPDGTVRSVSTVRRVRVMTVARMFADGKLPMEYWFACYWYKLTHDKAGVEGRYKTSNMSGMPTVSGSVNLSQHPMAQHAIEAEAREAIRAIRKMLGDKDCDLFEGVVLHDMPLRAASRHAKCSTSNLLPRFRDACDAVMRWCEDADIDLSKFAERNQGG